MVFAVRAVFVALLAFASASVGFAVQAALPPALVAESKGMIGSIVGLEATLVALVLGLLIWTSHGLFTAQQTQWQTVGRAILLLDVAFEHYGPAADRGRHELAEILGRMRQRFWIAGPGGRRVASFGDFAADVVPMRTLLVSLRPETDEQRQHLGAARDHFGIIVDTQLTMARTLVNPVPHLLFNSVFAWSGLLFFGDGLTSAINPLTIAMAALGAASIGSAAFLILELSDPYVGMFQMSPATFEGLVQTLARRRQGAAMPDAAPVT